jgi:replicative DNA helicase
MDRRREQPQGLSVGLSDFDSLTSGLEPGDLIVIAARPGVGKTALAVTLMLNTSEHAPVAFFSAEMPALQLMRRAVARESSVSQRKLRRAEQLTDSDWSVIADAVGIIARRPIWIDDKPLPSLTHVRAECMLRKAQGGLGLVLIDYIQLVQGRGKNRYEELRDVSYGLKALAKELAVPIVVLAQLNRSVESREQKRPHISDLRDCGAIEEAADIVGLLYSEGYYHPDCSMPYVLECAIAKNRNGERGECLWRFNGDHSRVTVLETGATAQYRHNRAKQHTARGNEDL